MEYILKNNLLLNLSNSDGGGLQQEPTEPAEPAEPSPPEGGPQGGNSNKQKPEKPSKPTEPTKPSQPTENNNSSQATKDQATKDQATKDQATRDEATRDQTVKNTSGSFSATGGFGFYDSLPSRVNSKSDYVANRYQAVDSSSGSSSSGKSFSSQLGIKDNLIKNSSNQLLSKDGVTSRIKSNGGTSSGTGIGSGSTGGVQSSKQSSSSGGAGGSGDNFLTKKEKSWADLEEIYNSDKSIDYTSLLLNAFQVRMDIIAGHKSTIKSFYSTDYTEIRILKNNYEKVSSEVGVAENVCNITENTLQDAQSEYNKAILLDGQAVPSDNKPSDILDDVGILEGTIDSLKGYCRICSARAEALSDKMTMINNGYINLYNEWQDWYDGRVALWMAFRQNHSNDEEKKNMSLATYWQIGVATGSWLT